MDYIFYSATVRQIVSQAVNLVQDAHQSTASNPPTTLEVPPSIIEVTASLTSEAA